MEDIRYVIDELNRPPFLKGYNLLAYDALRPDQRLDLLIELLNTIDPKLSLPSVRGGGSGVAIEDTVAAILEQLRIFKFRVPFEYGSGGHAESGAGGDFRRDLLTGDKDLHTLLLKWLFERASALKKRAYLARFLVKIEVPAEVEGDHDVVTLYQQYQRTIDDFKRTHAASEAQKKALDALIELQRDIHSMELERDQAKSKLEAVKRRVDTGANASTEGLFEVTRKWALIRAESDKLARQAAEQETRIAEVKRQLEEGRAKLMEHRTTTSAENITSNGLIEQLKDEITILRRGVGAHLPAELERLRSTVEDMETIAVSGENENVLRDYLTRIEGQISSLESEVRKLLDKKLMSMDEDDNDMNGASRKTAHYRRNAENVAARRDKAQNELNQLEEAIRSEEIQLQDIRTKVLQNSSLGEMHREALNVALERWTSRDSGLQQRLKELKQFEIEVSELESKANELRTQDANIENTINEIEERLGLAGYFAMKEHSLLEQPVDNDPDGDGIEGTGLESAGVETMNAEIVRLRSIIEQTRAQLSPLVREVKIQKQQLNEFESELGMKKRLYESAAAGLEADIVVRERELENVKQNSNSLGENVQSRRTQQLIVESTRDWFFADPTTILATLSEQLHDEEAEIQSIRRRQENEFGDESKRQQTAAQIEMWRNVDVLLDIKSRILASQKHRDTNTSASMGAYNHLVL